MNTHLVTLGPWLDLHEREQQEYAHADGAVDPALREAFAARVPGAAETVPLEYHLAEDPSDTDLGICSQLTSGNTGWLRPLVLSLLFVATVLVCCALIWPDAWR